MYKINFHDIEKSINNTVWIPALGKAEPITILGITSCLTFGILSKEIEYVWLDDVSQWHETNSSPEFDLNMMPENKKKTVTVNAHLPLEIWHWAPGMDSIKETLLSDDARSLNVEHDMPLFCLPIGKFVRVMDTKTFCVDANGEMSNGGLSPWQVLTEEGWAPITFDDSLSNLMFLHPITAINKETYGLNLPSQEVPMALGLDGKMHSYQGQSLERTHDPALFFGNLPNQQ